MRQASTSLEIPTAGRGLVEITDQIMRWLSSETITTGLLTLFCRHTSASLIVQENADPHVRRDLDAFFARIAPEGRGLYAHDSEGADDMPAHIRSALTQTSLSIPVQERRLALGVWQGIYLYEHRRSPHRRTVALHLIGD